MTDSEPYAWVIPGDDQARPNGSIDAMAWREGEFTRPLYSHPSRQSVGDDRDVFAEIRAKRQQQILKGYDADHDDQHTDGSIARGAAAFALAAGGPVEVKVDRKRVGMYRGRETLTVYPNTIWPWENGFSAGDPRDALIDAAAMIVAEIERLDRRSGK